MPRKRNQGQSRLRAYTGKSTRRTLGILAVLALILAQSFLQPQGEAASLNEVSAAAKKEGTIDFYASSTLTPQGAKALEEAFNKKYGVGITVRFTGAGSMIRDVARVVTELSTGARPTWDLMLVTDAHYATLIGNDAVETFDYPRTFGLDPKVLFFDGKAIAFATQFVAPAYNTKLLKPADAPKTWNDLLNPKWKGKMGISTATHHWARLAQEWGEKKTDEFVKKLMELNPSRGNVGTVYTRLELGETLVAASMSDSFVNEAKEKGAPVAFIENPDPIVAGQYMAAALKGAAHPNAARLMAYFLITPEAQKLWEKYQGQTSMFIPGTPAFAFAQKHRVLVATDKFAREKLDELTEKYGKMIGLR